MHPKRQLGLASATALVVANMIGTGVFTTSGFALADLRSPWWVLAAWLAGGVFAALGALCYGALARRFPESGGEYLFLSRTLHPVAGHCAGWISLWVGFSAPVAAAAYGFGEYTKAWFPDCHPKWLGTALLLGFTLLHGGHVRGGAWVQNAAVALKVGLIVGFVAVAWPRVPAPAPAAVVVSLPSFAMTLVWISFSYSGWNAAVYVGGEVIRPERNLPLALGLGTGLVTLLYLALNAVFVFSAPVSELAGRVEIGQVAAHALGGRRWADAITLLVDLALITSVSSMTMAGPRVYARMAADGYLPRWLAAEGRPPRGSIALQSGLALVMLWTASFQALLTFIGFTLSLSTAATVLGLLRLRGREGARVAVPGWPVVPWLFLVGVLAMAILALANISWPAVAKLWK